MNNVDKECYSDRDLSLFMKNDSLTLFLSIVISSMKLTLALRALMLSRLEKDH